MNMPSVSFVSLGCPKNLVDSEKMLGLLAEAGCAIVGGGNPGDVLIVNTCGFLSAAREEALEAIHEAAALKDAGDIQRLIVAGCLVQRDGQGLLNEVPQIDALVGVNNRRDIIRAVTGRTSGAIRSQESSGDGLFLGDYHASSWQDDNRSDRTRLRLTPGHYAYLRMSEGCNQKCTFCTIPSIRGPLHSKPLDEILAEARELIDDGAVEINLIGQDTTSYGRDIDGSVGLAGLLRAMNGLDGVRWLRLMYAYPTDFTDEMIDAIAECDRVVKYIDMPLQHINDRILKAMHRRVTRKQTEALLDRLHDRIDGVTIRTTLISGFPGETEAEHAELLAFVREARFEMLGVFPYSSEPGTPAHAMKDAPPPEIVEERIDDLMLTQQGVAFEKAAARVGEVFDVLIDDFGDESVYPARHAGQAPDVDSIVQVEGGDHDPGDFVTVRCTGTQDYDLFAKPDAGSLRILR